MRHHHFKALLRHPSLRNLLVDAALIGERMIESFPVMLFQQEGTYIEVLLSSTGTEVITARSFTEMEELEPYLEAIALPDFS